MIFFVSIIFLVLENVELVKCKPFESDKDLQAVHGKSPKRDLESKKSDEMRVNSCVDSDEIEKNIKTLKRVESN